LFNQVNIITLPNFFIIGN